jgi:hypothetical protein
MSSSHGSTASLFDEVVPNLAFLRVDQSEAINYTGDIPSSVSKVPLIGDVPPNIDYSLGLRSKYSSNDETFLRYN